MTVGEFAEQNILFRKNAMESGRPSSFFLLGRVWDLLDGVFAPIYTASTELFSRWLPYPPGGSFLEVGCGAGITAVMAALSGCRQVTALDIVEAAVLNTRLNVARHGVQGRVRVLVSDMMQELGADELFDVIFWNSNFVEPPADFVNTEDLHHALFDPGYAAHRAFIATAPSHLVPGGRLLLGFSNLGNRRLLDELAGRNGLTIDLIRSQRQGPVEYQLLKVHD